MLTKILFRRITDWPALGPSVLLHDPDMIVVDEIVVAILPWYNTESRSVEEIQDRKNLIDFDLYSQGTP